MRFDNILTKEIELPIGKMIAGASDKGICLLEYNDEKRLSRSAKELSSKYLVSSNKLSKNFLDILEVELKEYFNDKRTAFNVPIDLQGTPFQITVWQYLMTIPYGITKSYKQQSTEMNNPLAIRAIAKANGENRMSIIIPCHRVISSDGSLRGYGGGLWRKEFLINLEQNQKTIF